MDGCRHPNLKEKRQQAMRHSWLFEPFHGRLSQYDKLKNSICSSKYRYAEPFIALRAISWMAGAIQI